MDECTLTLCETNHEGDWEAVHQMFVYLGSQHRERQIVRMVRLGKKRRDGNQMRPLKIIFEHRIAAKEILDKSPRLAFSTVFGMINIKRDLTLDQRLNRPQHNSRTAESINNNQRPDNRMPTYSVVNEEHTTSRTVNPNNLVVVANAESNFGEQRQETGDDNSYYIQQFWGNLGEQRQGAMDDNRFYIQHFYNDGDEEEDDNTGSRGEGGVGQGNGWGGRVRGIV